MPQIVCAKVKCETSYAKPPLFGHKKVWNQRSQGRYICKIKRGKSPKDLEHKDKLVRKGYRQEWRVLEIKDKEIDDKSEDILR